MRVRLVGILVVLPACLTFAPLSAGAAQQQRARITGVVRDSAGTLVGGVAVMLQPGERVANTDAVGRFRFDSLAPGLYQLRARKLGFLPATYFVRVAGADTAIGLRIARRPQLLDTVVVSGRECSRVYFEGFLCRRAKGEGIYLTEADILAKNARFLADVVRGIEGFRIEPTVGLYGPGRKIAVAESRCVVTALNGRGFVASSGPMIDGQATITMDELITPDNLIGVEIYPPGTYAPVEYGSLAEQQERGSVMRMSGFKSKGRQRRAQSFTQRCSFVNYWTTDAIRRPRASTAPAAPKPDSTKPDSTKPPA